MFNKKPKIEFYNVIDGIADQMPIVPSSKIIHEWKKTAAEEFGSTKAKCPITGHTTVSKCPAINNIQTCGWVLRLNQDVTIDCDRTGETIQWATSTANNDDVSLHPIHAYHKYRKHWPVQSAPQVVKFHLGWYATIPKGYDLLQIPIGLADENNFTAVEGMYSSDLGPAGMTIPVYWHALGQTKTLKAGTPLAQLILVKSENIEYSVGNITEEQKDNLAINDKFFSQSFYRNYNTIKKYWKSVGGNK